MKLNNHKTKSVVCEECHYTWESEYEPVRFGCVRGLCINPLDKVAKQRQARIARAEFFIVLFVDLALIALIVWCIGLLRPLVIF